MLNVQRYLREGKTLDDLERELGVATFRHPELPMVGLKYRSYAPRLDPIVRECRGLVLESGSWEVVAKPFDRFVNAGEDLDGFARFRWERCWCQSKEDGSLVIVYWYGGAWHVNSSGSFGHLQVSHSGKTWAGLFWYGSGLEPSQLDPGLTYVFELCSPYTKVVRSYPRTTAYLLSMFDPRTCQELTVEHVDREAVRLRQPRPETYPLSSMAEVTALLQEKERDDPTFEGVILRDDSGSRFKVKTRTYLEAHRGEGRGLLFHPRRMVSLILTDEIHEVVAYVPELKEEAERLKAEIDQAWEQLRSLWKQTWQIEEQKAFAQAIVGQSPFSGLLFTLRRLEGANQSEERLRQLWQASDELIARIVTGRNR